MQSPMQADQVSLALKTLLLCLLFKDRVDLIDQTCKCTVQFADDIAFEGVAFADWVMAQRFALVFMRAAPTPLADIEGRTIPPPQHVNVTRRWGFVQPGFQIVPLAQKACHPRLQQVLAGYAWARRRGCGTFVH